MKRTKIQRIIIPRNWLFGRISYCYANLRNVRLNNKVHLTVLERIKLEEAEHILLGVIKNKKPSSEILKHQIKKEENEK